MALVLLELGAGAAMISEHYSIPSLTVSGSCGSPETTAYHLTDIKGQAAAGAATRETLVMWFGGVYGELGPRAWDRDPYVRDLKICRAGFDVQLSWVPDTTTPPGTRFYIFRLVGPFSSEAVYWPEFWRDTGTGSPGDIMSWQDRGQVGAGSSPEVYYRVTSSPDKTRLSNFPALGKVNIVCGPGDNLVSFPFVKYWQNSTAPESDSAAVAIGDQMQRGDSRTADTVYRKRSASGYAYDYAFIDSLGNWEYHLSTADPYLRISPNEGYFIRRRPGASNTITVAGQLTTEAFVHLEEGDNLIGISFPKNVALHYSGFSPTGRTGDSRTADIIFKKTSAAGYGYDGAYLALGGFWYDVKTRSVSTQELSVSNGYFYRRRTGAGPADVRRIMP